MLGIRLLCACLILGFLMLATMAAPRHASQPDATLVRQQRAVKIEADATEGEADLETGVSADGGEKDDDLQVAASVGYGYYSSYPYLGGYYGGGLSYYPHYSSYYGLGYPWYGSGGYYGGLGHYHGHYF